MKLSLGWLFSSDFRSAPMSALFLFLIAVVENCVKKVDLKHIFLQESFLGRLCTSLRGRLQKRTKTRCTMCEFHILRSTTRRLGCRTFIFSHMSYFFVLYEDLQLGDWVSFQNCSHDRHLLYHGLLAVQLNKRMCVMCVYKYIL